MNELVSKNPVLRFKLGKKIEKFYRGGSWAGYYTVGNWPVSGSTVTRPKRTTTTSSNATHSQVAAQGKYNREVANGLRDPMLDVILPWLRYVAPQLELPVEQSALQLVLQLRRPVVRRTPTYYATRAYRGKIPVSGLNSRAAVMEYLKKLNKLGANIKVDGIWGDKTDKAYQTYMNNLLPTEAIKASPLSLVEKSNINPNDFVSLIENKYGKPTVESISTQPVATLYDRSGTRDWITNRLGHNPYEYTGAQRRALRYWLNGDKEGNNYDKNLLGVFGNLSLYAKQGAKLVSKNPVLRFKTKLNGHLNFR